MSTVWGLIQVGPGWKTPSGFFLFQTRPWKIEIITWIQN